MALILAENLRSEYRILLPENPAPAVAYAGEELTRFLGEMTGAAFYPARKEDEKVISLAVDAALEEEELAVDILPEGKITLRGGSPRGVLYAVYTFLDRLGCRWFTKEVSRIPKRNRLAVDFDSFTTRPALEYREPFFTEAKDAVWAARNRVNGQSMVLTEREGGKVTYFPGRFVHTFYPLLPPEKYFESHPEYYSMVDGVRTTDRAQLCLTNPEVLKLVTEQVRAEIRANPDCRIFSVSQNDCYNPCTCPECAKVDEEEGSQAGTLLRFVNAVAEELEPEFPDVWFDTLAYQYTRKAPKLTKPRPNVIVRLCSIECCFSHPLGTCNHFIPRLQQMGDFLQDLEDWSAICNRLYIWDYVTNFHDYLLPYPNTEVLAPNLRFFLAHNVKGVFEEGSYAPGGGGYLAEMHAYMLGKLMWDPDLDERMLADEFIAGVYGAAAPIMRRIFDAYRAEIEKEDAHLFFSMEPADTFKDGKAILAIDALFDEAKRAADDLTVLRQVEKAELWQRYLKLSHTPKSPARDVAVDVFMEDCRSFGIGALNEWTDFEKGRENLKSGNTAVLPAME